VFSAYLKNVALGDVMDSPPSIAAGAAAAAAAQRRRSSGQGKKSPVGRPVQRFVVDVIVRMDRANDGMTCPGIYEITEPLCPHLTQHQCKKSFTETIRYRFRKELTGIRHRDRTEEHHEAQRRHRRAAVPLAHGTGLHCFVRLTFALPRHGRSWKGHASHHCLTGVLLYAV